MMMIQAQEAPQPTPSAIKMDELLVGWLGSDEVYDNVLQWIDKFKAEQMADPASSSRAASPIPTQPPPESPQTVLIPPFYPLQTATGTKVQRRRNLPRQFETWETLPEGIQVPKLGSASEETPDDELQQDQQQFPPKCVKEQFLGVVEELGFDTVALSKDGIPMEAFVRVTKEICRFPSFFNGPFYQRILDLWNAAAAEQQQQHRTNHKKNTKAPPPPASAVTLTIFEWFWKTEMEPYDAEERLFRLLKQPHENCILRDDLLPYIKALLNEHPGLEFLSNHAEFQEKYAVTVITRIFYSVNKCHSGRITSRQVRRSDLLRSFLLVDDEEDINKVTRYFSYEHFYVLYCRFWELDHDRDYRITREDLLKYGDHALSHMIVDRIFDAAPRPFGSTQIDREFLSYEDFIYFMLSEEDKSNDVSVSYWFQCVDVDGDGKLNNMELRSFYAVQLHRMQVMGHEMVPFEDMLCQMMDMMKPKSQEYLVAEDFLAPACQQVSGALFDALFNLNKYLLFEQRDPFVERQKREDEFETDWDRFACIDYNRLAMEEEAREDEQMEIDWVTEEEEDNFEGPVTTEAPF